MTSRATFLATLLVAAALLPGCGRAAGNSPVEAAMKQAPARNAVSAQQREKDFPASVATLKSEGRELLVVRFRAQKLGFNQVSKVGFPVLVKGQQQFKSNLYLGTDDQLYISDLGTAKTPRYWRVGAYGVPAVLAHKPQEGAIVNLRFDPGIVFDIGLSESEDGKPGLTASMAIKSTPPATTEPPLWGAEPVASL
jgi:hypothetical protein